MRIVVICLLCFWMRGSVYAQTLEPGFNPTEYMEMIRLYGKQFDTAYPGFRIPAPKQFERVYRSPEMGLRNLWEGWFNRDKSVYVIALRGTTAQLASWMENFYAAMIPAQGTMKISDSLTVQYQFAKHPQAMVHVGWALGACVLWNDIKKQISPHMQQGVRNFIITGHSQGGALSFLVTSLMRYEMINGTLPNNVQVKTYASAAPKPGNMFYAYDYDYITRNGWAFTVINALDWVPETPMSVQTLTDFNPVNPFVDARKMIKKQALFVRMYLNAVYGKFDRTTRKAQRQFEKYLGNQLQKFVQKQLPEYEGMTFEKGNNYQRAGIPVVLMPDSTYEKEHPNPGHVFWHHMFEPYYDMTRKIYGVNE